MEASTSTTKSTWDNLPLECVVGFLDPVETLIFALTCSSSRVAVKSVHRGKVPPMKTTYMLDLVKDGRLEMIKWVRALKPPCPCDFVKCRQLASDETVEMYFQLGLDLISECASKQMSKAMDLIGHGVDVQAKRSGGQMPLNYACYFGHKEVVMALLAKGADVLARDNKGNTPLHDACNYGLAEVVMVLLQMGADVDAETNVGETSLHEACFYGHAEAAMVLLEGGADVNAVTNNGSTPLHVACYYGKTEVAMELLKNGANVLARRRDGDTPLYLARTMGHTRLAAMLLENGGYVG